jgi:hypothetical protein
MNTPRTEVYAALDSERDYQDQKWGIPEDPSFPTVTEFLTYMRDYTEEALHILSREPVPEADQTALHNVRKVGALAVACMEQHGAPKREV